MVINLLQAKIELSQLPCFEKIGFVTELTKGESHPAFRVETESGSYFAKYFSNNQQLVYESHLNNYLNSHELTLKSLYAEQNWLILPFVDEYKASCNVKLHALLWKLAKLHQLQKPQQVEVKVIRFSNVLTDLISHVSKTEEQHLSWTKSSEKLLAPLNDSDSDSTRVLCHGDANYQNILFSSPETSYLIDFESVCLAPCEYDLGMLLAINLIELNKVEEIISYYVAQREKPITIDLKMVMRYQNMSLLINGLWYFAKYQSCKSEHWLNKARNQLLPLSQQELVPKTLIL